MVIIGFTAATLQLSLLVRKYLQFQVVELSEIKDSMPVEFPSVTVCNIEPISWRKLRLLFQNPEDTELMQWLNFTNRSGGCFLFSLAKSLVEDFDIKLT